MADRRPIGANEAPIDYLKPGTEQHAFVLQQIMARLRYSAREMAKFYPRWRYNELTLQAYVGLNDFDQMLKDANDRRGGSGTPVEINVPFAWATTNTIVTYLLHMFAGRQPIFQVSSYRAEQVDRAKNMETFLQFNADVIRFVRNIYFFLMDGETYGVAIMRNLWREDKKTRTIWTPPTPELVELGNAFGKPATPTGSKQTYISFQGNDVSNIDPFMFFPDPRVPMQEVNEKGEFVFWRAFEGRHRLKQQEAQGNIKWVNEITSANVRGYETESSQSVRGMRSLGAAHPGDPTYSGNVEQQIKANVQIDQGTIDIIPKDWGLGDSEVPEKWMFSVANEGTIIQAEPANLPHGKHPVVVAEPQSVGYSFGQLGSVDMLGPMQGLMSWFMNTHIYNVRAALNNMFIADPTKVEMQDFRQTTNGVRVIRLKNTAFGLSDPKNAIQQLQVADVTRGHVADFQLFGKLAADLTGATDNVRGNQDSGGRKTATEVRTASDAGTSRLAAKGTLYSTMGFVDLAEQQSYMVQEYLTEEYELGVLGEAARVAPLRVNQASVQGDFTFPVHDGSMPMDKLGMLEVWKEIFAAVLADPEIRAHKDVLAMFDWIAQLGGAQNIKSFNLKVVPQSQQQADLAGGNGVPMEQAMAELASRMAA